MRAFLVIGLVGLLGCGDPGAANGDRLSVAVSPQGDGGPVERRVITTIPEGIGPEDFDAVPPGTACAEIYGGPARAHVTGTLDGRRIDARFNRVNACEIARWDRLAALLGRAPE